MKEKLNTRSEESSSGWDVLEDTPSFENGITNLDDFNEEGPFSDYDFDIALEKTVDIATLSRPMKDFFERQGYDIYNLPLGLGRPLLDVEDIGDMYYKSGSWREAKRSDIFIGDIVGSQGIKKHNSTLASFMSYLYRDYDIPSSYTGRDVEHLQGDYKKTAQAILDNLTPGDYVSDGKNYFLCGDGNHRIFFLATALELELAECGDNEAKKSEIISKYTIPAMIKPTDSIKDLGAILEEKTKSTSFTDELDLDEYGKPDSASSLEKSKVQLLKYYEKILSSPDALQTTSKNYLEQYQPGSKSRADILFCKDMLDHYVLDQLSGDNAKDFIKSDRFKNYSSYIISMAQQKVQIINGKKYYPELATNPVLSNLEYRRLVISELRPADQVNRIVNNLNKNEANYKGFIKTIENRLENSANVSQGELNMVGDYLYSGRDFDSGLAKKFACYMFNEARQRQDLSSSTQIGGALANYFAHKNTLDDRLKEGRIIIANNVGWDNKNNKLKSVNAGVSTTHYCVLEQNKINEMSLSSEEGISKSRPETITDLYSFMLVSFHELTHDYQKLMVTDGKKNSSAMAYILHQVLRNNQSECFPVVDKNLNRVFDEDGNEIKADYYRANHDSDEIEIQADEEAWRQCRKFIHEHEKQYYWGKKDEDGEKRASEHWFKCQKNEQEVRVRRAFTLKVDENGQEVPYIQYDIEELEKNIERNPSIIKQLPQLAEFFDSTGHVKPEIFFNKEIASVDDSKLMETITDDFGVEIATYALMDSSDVKNILSYIQNPNNDLSKNQVMRCVSNLWNVLRQDALKTRPLERVNFDNYSETIARGKNTDIGDLRKSYLKQYLHQLFNATHIAEVLRDRYPELGDNIEHQEQTYFILYYNELARGVSLEPAYSKNVKDLYMKTRNRALQQIAMQL